MYFKYCECNVLCNVNVSKLCLAEIDTPPMGISSQGLGRTGASVGTGRLGSVVQ